MLTSIFKQNLHQKRKVVCIKTRSTSVSRSLKGQNTQPTNVKWQIRHLHISHNAPCLSLEILHKPCLLFLFKTTVIPRGNQQHILQVMQSLGGKQGVLWEMCKWRIHHLRQDHNAPCIPPKRLHNHCVRFLLGLLKFSARPGKY